MITLQTGNPSQELLAAIRNEAWSLTSETVVQDIFTAVLGGQRRHWQVGFNNQTSRAVVIGIKPPGPPISVKADSPGAAVALAERSGG